MRVTEQSSGVGGLSDAVLAKARRELKDAGDRKTLAEWLNDAAMRLQGREDTE